MKKALPLTTLDTTPRLLLPYAIAYKMVEPKRKSYGDVKLKLRSLRSQLLMCEIYIRDLLCVCVCVRGRPDLKSPPTLTRVMLDILTGRHRSVRQSLK